MKNGSGIYDEQYRRMGGKPNVKRCLELFNVMSDYMQFYEDWIKTCIALNRKVENPNRVLAMRWWKR